MAGLWAAEARLRLGTGAAVAAAVQERCLVEFEDCDGLGSILGGARDGVPEGPAAPAEGRATSARPGRAHGAAPRGRLEALEIYGLGTHGAPASLPDLAAQLGARLAPYYSPARRAREEYAAEAASFAVLRALEAYVRLEEMAARRPVICAAAAGLGTRAHAAPQGGITGTGGGDESGVDGVR